MISFGLLSCLLCHQQALEWSTQHLSASETPGCAVVKAGTYPPSLS